MAQGPGANAHAVSGLRPLQIAISVTGNPSEPPLPSGPASSESRSLSLTSTLPRKGRQPCQGHTARPRALRLELGPRSAEPPALSLPPPKWIWQSRGGARAWQQPGEGGRQAGSWGWWEEPSSPVFSKPESPSPSCTPERWVAASRHAFSLQWAEGKAPSLWLGLGGQGEVGGQAEGRGEDHEGSLHQPERSPAPFTAGVTES